MRDHPQRAHERGLGRIAQALVANLGGAIGDGGDVERGREPLICHGLCQKEQAVEALFLYAVEKARSGAVAGVLRDQPEMRDAGGQAAFGAERADEGIIAFTPAFGRQGIAPRRKLGEGIASSDIRDRMACGGKPLAHG